MHPIILNWKTSLSDLLYFYESKRPKFIFFFPSLFIFFILINIACYWWAMLTAFPELLAFHGSFHYYFKIQFPVGFLGALFDSLSFFVTIYIIRMALKSSTTSQYIGHLSIDLVIAILATFWVVFVFSISGWIIGIFENRDVLLSERNAEYTELVVSAVKQPLNNLRNIYFGLIMGISAMIPTCIHMAMSVKSVVQVVVREGSAQE